MTLTAYVCMRGSSRWRTTQHAACADECGGEFDLNTTGEANIEDAA